MDETESGAVDDSDAINTLLRLFAQASSRREYLDAVVDLVRRWSGARCVGLRVSDGEGNIPYESYLGFDREFWESENWLSVQRDCCICTRVVLGQPEPQDELCMTPRGSFRTDNSIDFVRGLSPRAQGRYRGFCMRRGFASLAVIPVRYRDETVGAFHLADEREGRIAPSAVEFIESVSPLIGEAVHRFHLEDELRRNNDVEAVLNRLLRMAMEDVPLVDLLRVALDLLHSVHWLPLREGGEIFLREEGVGGLAVEGRQYTVPIRAAGKPLGEMVLRLADDQPLRRRDEDFLSSVASVVAGIVVRQRTQEALRRSEARFRRLAENSQDLIYRYELGPVRGFSYLSPAASSIFGYSPEELYAEPDLLRKAVHPEDKPKLESLLSGASVDGMLTVRWRHPSGHVVFTELRGVPVGENGRVVAIEGIARDITEREQMAQKVLRAERLEMAGQVAGQVAHDFSNMLSPLGGYPQLIRRLLPQEHPAVKYCDALQKSVKRMAAINEDLLTLGRRGRLTLESVDLNLLVEQTVQQMSETLNGVQVELHLASNLPALHGQGAQLSRVLANLLSNARDATAGSGRVTVDTRIVRVDRRVGRYGQVEPGEYALLMVADTGTGIEPEILDRVFDPFFSTKRAERESGSGLGLSIVQAIVSDHGGYVDVESEVGKGTTFSVYLPLGQALLSVGDRPQS